MKNWKFGLFVLLIASMEMNAADDYEPGDTLYVWARNGLHLRQRPGTKSKVVTTLPFGTTVIVVEKSDVKYNVKIVSKTQKSYRDEKVHPLILKGNWAKLRTIDGKIGYSIDPYLLSLKPVQKKERKYIGLSLKLLSLDTVYSGFVIRDGSDANFEVEAYYDGGIIHRSLTGGVWGESYFTIPNMTIAEALIFFSQLCRDYDRFEVERNWKEEVIMNDGELCQFVFRKIKTGVQVNIYCSC